jgi:hypothetical protein
MNYTEAFSEYGAKLTNRLWSVSAFGTDGSLVVSLWQDHIKRCVQPGMLEYSDNLSTWLGNESGRKEFKNHLYQVQAKAISIRLVIAHPLTPDDAKLVGMVADETKIKKIYSVRKEFIGILDFFDGDRLHIVFRKAN